MIGNEYKDAVSWADLQVFLNIVNAYILYFTLVNSNKNVFFN